MAVQIEVTGVKLTSLQSAIDDAMCKKYQIKIHSHPKSEMEQAQDILKCNYVAMYICRRGYDSCVSVGFLPNDM